MQKEFCPEIIQIFLLFWPQIIWLHCCHAPLALLRQFLSEYFWPVIMLLKRLL